MAQVTLCNLLSYQVKSVDIQELHFKCNDSSIKDVVKSYFKDLADQKLHIYTLNYNGEIGFVHSLGSPTNNISLKSLKCSDDIKKDGVIVILNIYLIGQCTLNQDSFSVLEAGDRAKVFDERHKALQFFALFCAKLSDTHQESLPELNHIVTNCLENKYINHNLNSFNGSVSASQTFSSADIGKRLERFPRFSSVCTGQRFGPTESLTVNQEGCIDNLINICNTLTSQICKIIRCKIEERNYKPDWADILKEGEFVHISFTHQSNSYNLKIESDVFDAIEYHCRGEMSKTPTFNGELKTLGNPGAFGRAYAYTPNTNKEALVVIKRNRTCQDSGGKPAWYREVHHTLALCHENIIKYYSKPILYGDHYYCIMEHGGYSLEEQYCRGTESAGRKMELLDISNVASQISCAINYLHSRNPLVIHRDIRTANVTYNSSSRLYKLIDFGLSSEKNEEESSKIVSNTEWGNYFWKSPEFCWHNITCEPNASESEALPEPGRKSDIWMFGILLLELVAFPERPSFFNEYRRFPALFMRSLVDKTFDIALVIENCLTSGIFEENNKKLIFDKVLQRCLEFHPEQRADSEEIERLCQQLLE